MKIFSKKPQAVWLFFWSFVSIGFLIADQLIHHSAHSLEFALQSGFDSFGRSLWHLVPTAAAMSLGFAAITVLISILFSMTVGSLFCLFHPVIQQTFLRFLDLMLAFPSILLALAWAAVFGPGWSTLFSALLVGILPSLTRLSFLRASEIVEESYVESAVALGISKLRLIRNHIFPGLAALIRVKVPNLFAHALIAEATLTFLGLGAPHGSETWGSLLAQGKEYLLEAPHIAMMAGVPLVVTVLALQQLTERRYNESTP